MEGRRLTDYIKVYNSSNSVAVSQIFKSWYLKNVENLTNYLQEYSINVTDTKFTDQNGTISVPTTLYRGIIPDQDNTLIVLSNPSDTPIYLYTGYGVASIADHYDKNATSTVYKMIGKGLYFHIACSSRSVVENMKVLTFSPTRNTSNVGYGLQIFNDNQTLLFSAIDFPIKLIAHRKTDYSDSPRYFYYGRDDVQGAVYNSNNYFQCSYPDKTIGFFCDIAVTTPIYVDHSYHHTVHSVSAKMTKNSISTGIMEFYGSLRHTKHYYMDGTESSFTYWNGYSEPRFSASIGETCEQNTFSVFDVTNYYK